MAPKKSPNAPGLTPPSGVTPNFDGPYTLEPYQKLTVAPCIVVTTVMVAARLYTKICIIKALKWEDCKEFALLTESVC